MAATSKYPADVLGNLGWIRKVQTRYVGEARRAPHLKGPSDVVAAMKAEALPGLLQETFWVMILNGRHCPLAIEHVSLGTISGTLVHPREVFRTAVRKSASAIILIHNHPSGECEPSEDDRSITRRLAKCGELLGIKVIDHVVIAADGWVSLREELYAGTGGTEGAEIVST